jgi:hypothetical protein
MKILLNIRNRTDIVIRLLFFLFFYLYLLVWVNPSVSYFIQQPVFLFEKNFLFKHLSHPGGITEYLSQFLSQFYYFPWLGALIVTLIVWLITYITGKIIISLGLKRNVLLLQLIPAITLIFLHGKYEYKLESSLVLLFSLTTFLYYLRVSGLKFIYKITVIFLSSVVLYYLSGGDALVLYIIMCLVLELISATNYKSFISADFLILIALLVPWLSARFIFYINLKQAYLHLLAPEEYYIPSPVLYGLYIFYPLLVLYIKLREYFINRTQIKVLPRKLIKKESLIKPEIVFEFLLIIILTVFAVMISVKSEKKLIDKVKYLAYNEEWEKLLELVKDNNPDNRIISFHTNRALFHTGKLACDLFEYSQNFGKYGLLMEGILDIAYLMDNSDLYFDMGHIGAAQHWAYEAQTKYENSPRVLKRLALTNIINGDFGAAKSILRILKKSILHKKWAGHYLLCIDDPLKLEEDSLVQMKRNIQPRDDFFISDILDPKRDLQYILEENIHNRMAFEYLMAYYLLDKDLGSFVNYMIYVYDIGYKEIPKNYEEALLFYISLRDAKRIDLERYKLKRNTLERYRDYAGIILKNNRSMEAAEAELNKYHGNTYWYYAHYIKPAMSKEEIETYSKK